MRAKDVTFVVISMGKVEKGVGFDLSEKAKGERGDGCWLLKGGLLLLNVGVCYDWKEIEKAMDRKGR